ncbi:MAG TPA: SPOR domain-containing protein [Bacteroidales bacterium]|nr:SPOR domain-containing protein [Bacteroidales bacterium]HPS74132.1 SPOR domain-containing protein [Bacteroidales bacterium]
MSRLILNMFFLLTLITSGFQAYAQQGGETVIRDAALDRLVEKHIRYNEKISGISGYRIQIFFDSGTNSKPRGQSVYEAFSARYPEVPAYLTFKSPNYKVRVGDFRSRLDAVRFLQEVLPDYPGAYVVKDQIHLPKAY